MASKEYKDGKRDWAGKGRLDARKAASSDYRKGAQDQRTKEVDDELRRMGGKR